LSHPGQAARLEDLTQVFVSNIRAISYGQYLVTHSSHVDDAVSSGQPAVLGTTGYIHGQDANKAKLCHQGHDCVG
jgi:hypothetical protein